MQSINNWICFTRFICSKALGRSKCRWHWSIWCLQLEGGSCLNAQTIVCVRQEAYQRHCTKTCRTRLLLTSQIITLGNAALLIDIRSYLSCRLMWNSIECSYRISDRRAKNTRSSNGCCLVAPNSDSVQNCLTTGAKPKTRSLALQCVEKNKLEKKSCFTTTSIYKGIYWSTSD